MPSSIQQAGGHQRQKGVGLVEIMISLVLGLLVTGAIVQIYLTTKRQNDMQGSLTARQESARFAAQVIQRDAQMAGFRGCLRDVGNVTNTLNNATNFLYRYERHVEGFENAVGVPASIASVVAGTDVLTLRTVDDPGVSTTAAMGSATANPVTVAGLAPARLVANDIALITDCGGASIFQVTGFDPATGIIIHAANVGTPGNDPAKNLVRRYAADSQVFTIRTTTLSVASFVAPAFSATAVSADELKRATDHLKKTSAAFIAATEKLSDAQLAFKPGPTRWSVAEVAEHIAAAEDFLMGMIKEKVMTAPARTAPANLKEIDDFVTTAIADRTNKVQAPEPLIPSRRFGSMADTMKHFKETRAKTLAFLKDTKDLREHRNGKTL